MVLKTYKYVTIERKKRSWGESLFQMYSSTRRISYYLVEEKRKNGRVCIICIKYLSIMF